MSFASYKNRNSNSIADIQEKIKNINSSNRRETLDETYWTYKHIMGSDGVGEAIIRFLPPPMAEDHDAEPDPIVKYVIFSKFDAPSKAYYKERGRNSLSDSEQDPANNYNMSVSMNKGLSKEEKKKLYFYRDQRYVANIYVVKDPHKPENNGKIFRMEFGYQIFKIIEAALIPKYETEAPIDIFDPENGADFYLRAETKRVGDGTIPNYENSKFGAVSKRWDYEEFDEIWKQEYSLQSEIAPEKFKSYDELNNIFQKFMARVNGQANDPMTPVGYQKVKEEREISEKTESFNFDKVENEAFDNLDEIKEDVEVSHSETDDSFFDDLM